MVLKILIGIAIGVLAGGLLGSARSCPSGGCPLTATPRRGAIWGGVLGLLFAVAACNPSASPASAPGKAGDAVIEIASADEYDQQILQHDGKAVVYFGAEWCGACKTFKPVFEKTAQRYAGQVRFAGVDVDGPKELGDRYGIEYLPTTIVFSSGKEVKRFVGVTTEEAIAEVIAKAG